MEQTSSAGVRAVVTGGSSGLGRAMVNSLARRAAHVTAIARDQDRLNAMSGGQIDVIAGDATDPSFMENVVSKLSSNALVLNAGAPLSLGDIDALSFEAFSSNWNVDVRAALVGIQAALHAPLQQGS